MKTSVIISVTIWAAIVGGNVVNTLTLAPQTFMGGPQLPWLVVFLPIVVVNGAYRARQSSGGHAATNLIDHPCGEGSYRQFIETLKPELMFSAMCCGIVISGLARAYLLGAPVLPPAILGFFASGSIAFLIAYYIRRRRGAQSAR